MRLDSDDFELFGLPRRFELDPAALDARWRELQAEVHPDRFVSQGSATQRHLAPVALPALHRCCATYCGRPKVPPGGQAVKQTAIPFDFPASSQPSL